jgi:hypothetical protein
VLGELREGHVPVVRAVDERADRGRLEEDVRVVLGVKLRSPQRRNVEGAYQSLVEDGGDRTGGTIRSERPRGTDSRAVWGKENGSTAIASAGCGAC